MPPRPPTRQHRVEYLALRAIVAVLALLPVRVAAALGGRLGRLGHLLGIRRATVEAQLRFAFPEFSEAEVARHAREAFDNLGRTAIESAVLALRGTAAIRDYVPIVGREHLDAARAGGRAVLVVSGHLGNWELAGATLAAHGYPTDGVARHMGNPYLERWLTRVREASGLRVVFDDEAVRVIPRAIRDGRLIGLLSDQGVVGLASSWVPFFGRVAKTPRGGAVFALRNGLPMVFAVAVRDERHRLRLVVEPLPMPPPTGDRDVDVDAIVAAYTARLEAWIRRHPGQYFWQHRRWKHQPPGAPPLPPGL